MNNQAINRYIDLCLIDGYADKNAADGWGYELDVTTLDNNDKAHFLDLLLMHDEIMQEIVKERMQEIIDARLEKLEIERRHDLGFSARRDQINGETIWRKIA